MSVHSLLLVEVYAGEVKFFLNLIVVGSGVGTVVSSTVRAGITVNVMSASHLSPSHPMYPLPVTVVSASVCTYWMFMCVAGS